MRDELCSKPHPRNSRGSLLFGWGLWVAISCRSHFGRMLGMGLTMTIFFYLAINLLMVMGLAPVVGVPLPLISYGGSAMMTVLMAFGLIFCVSINRDARETRCPCAAGRLLGPRR